MIIFLCLGGHFRPANPIPGWGGTGLHETPKNMWVVGSTPGGWPPTRPSLFPGALTLSQNIPSASLALKEISLQRCCGGWRVHTVMGRGSCFRVSLSFSVLAKEDKKICSVTWYPARLFE